PPIRTQATDSLRRASLIHRTEAFLLESLTSGYILTDIYQALDLAMERWRAIGSLPEAAPGSTLRFAGSHDMVINALARGIGEIIPAAAGIIPGAALQINFCGSLGGLIALAEGKAEIAGCHLLDAESNSYNLPFIQRVLPGKETLLIRLAHRRLGMITAPGNPHGLHGLADLAQANLRFVNRQSGSGTRVWLDNELKRLQIDSRSIPGYSDERLTHSDVARAVAEGEADCGLGLEASAFAYRLGFILLANECYDLAMLASTAGQPTVKALLDWLKSAEAKAFVATFPGYENCETGAIQPT
ncbi:MAG: substrate-binding domain-containing protein, partial [Anaerolineaceae bacterium]|nr:substrate-binding domain-containing protein [Anaerolineaceae bacterium]